MNFSLYKKEMKVHLFRPSFMVVTGILSLYLGVQFFYQLGFLSQMTQKSYSLGGSSLLEHLWAPYFGQINMILLFTSPFFVSRLFSEEKRQDCMLSLLASPMGSMAICLQKFLAGWTILLVFLGIAFIFPLASLFLFKAAYLPELFSGMLALILASSVYAAISLFSGILFSSLLMSGVFSVVINLSLWSIGIIFRDLISFKKMEWVEQFWIGKYLTDLFVANISFISLYFFLAFSFFFLFLSYQFLEEVERG